MPISSITLSSMPISTPNTLANPYNAAALYGFASVFGVDIGIELSVIEDIGIEQLLVVADGNVAN